MERMYRYGEDTGGGVSVNPLSNNITLLNTNNTLYTHMSSLSMYCYDCLSPLTYCLTFIPKFGSLTFTPSITTGVPAMFF